MSVSTDTLIYVFLLYAPIVLISYWKLIPRLLPASRRLASLMLMAQVILIAIEVRLLGLTSSRYEGTIWSLAKEGTIPSLFAFIQLALVGSTALITAWLTRARPAWQRLCLFMIGLVFLFIGLVEYFVIYPIGSDPTHTQQNRDLAALGVIIATATMAVAVRSPRRTWIWHLCLLAGMTIGMMGIALDGRSLYSCVLCKHLKQIEESFELVGIWVTLVAMLGLFSNAAPLPKPRVRGFLYALPALWLLLVFIHSSIIIPLELRHLAQPASVQFETGLTLHGYRIDIADETLGLVFYVSGKARDYGNLHGWSLHLVDPISGEAVFSYFQQAHTPSGFPLFGPDYESIYRNWIDIKIPPQILAKRALWVALRTGKERGKGELSILASDHPLLDDTQVVLGELRSLTFSPARNSSAVQ